MRSNAPVDSRLLRRARHATAWLQVQPLGGREPRRWGVYRSQYTCTPRWQAVEYYVHGERTRERKSTFGRRERKRGAAQMQPKIDNRWILFT